MTPDYDYGAKKSYTLDFFFFFRYYVHIVLLI